jgi:hypothetical protein
MAKMRVHLKAHRHIYIHNDIGNAAFYFKNRVNERIAKGERDGVGLEIIAGLTLLAFEVEARFNFIGRTPRHDGHGCRQEHGIGQMMRLMLSL